MLTGTQWPCVESVYLTCGKHASEAAKLFMSCKWPVLSHLDLSTVNLDVLMCTRLSTMDIPLLEVLVVQYHYHCYLDSSAMKELIKADWGLLRRVHLKRFAIPERAAGVVQLVQAHWGSLCVLEISACCLEEDAVSELAEGHWPSLHSLVLFEQYKRGYWSIDSVKRLLDGVWPLLDHLVLSASAPAAHLLSGSPELVIGTAVVGGVNNSWTTVTGHGPDQWPCLKFTTLLPANDAAPYLGSIGYGKCPLHKIIGVLFIPNFWDLLSVCQYSLLYVTLFLAATSEDILSALAVNRFEPHR